MINDQTERAVRAGQLSQKTFEAMRGALAELRAGRTVTKRPPNIPNELWVGLFQPRAQEYLISLFRYDPAEEIAKLPPKKVQVLVVIGTTDLKGTVKDRTKLAEAVGAKPVLIVGMNHELKTAPLDRAANDAASEDPKRPLAGVGRGSCSGQRFPLLVSNRSKVMNFWMSSQTRRAPS